MGKTEKPSENFRAKDFLPILGTFNYVGRVGPVDYENSRREEGIQNRTWVLGIYNTAIIMTTIVVAGLESLTQ